MKIFKKLLSYISYGIRYLKTFGFRKKSRFVSRGERLIYHYLKDCGDNIKFKPQYKIPIPEGINKTNRAYIDFMVWIGNKRYAIEYNGIQHYEFTPYFHRTYDDFYFQTRRDLAVESYCFDKGITFVEIPYYWSDTRIIHKLKEITHEA